MKDKNNLFLDKRIGERNSAMTAEDKILARYTAERMKFHSKVSSIHFKFLKIIIKNIFF